MHLDSDILAMRIPEADVQRKCAVATQRFQFGIRHYFEQFSKHFILQGGGRVKD